MTATAEHPDDIVPASRMRILEAALALTRKNGSEAATTRAVAAAAGVQVPTIYRLFGDKQGLLDAVAEHGVATYVAGKAGGVPGDDPVEDLRHGWDNHVAFGLANPSLFAIMSANPRSAAAAKGLRILSRRIRAIAEAGRLRTSEEQAVAMMHACCVGLVMTLAAAGAPAGGALSVATREAVLAAIALDAPAARFDRPAAAATLRAMIDPAAGLTVGEVALLDELLHRLSTRQSRSGLGGSGLGGSRPDG